LADHELDVLRWRALAADDDGLRNGDPHLVANPARWSEQNERPVGGDVLPRALYELHH
jgi:hypothetical protein